MMHRSRTRPGSAPLQFSLPFDDSATVVEPAARSKLVILPRPARPTPAPTPGPSSAVVAYVRHPRAKRYVIRVRADGSVRVTIPRWGSKREAAAFVDAQHGWIRDQREHAARAREARRPALPVEEARMLRARAKRELPSRLLELAARFGLAVRKVSVRNQRWRWGSCSRQAHICLNWRLVDMPASVRDYVLIHELMHLRRLDHSAAFWKLVAAACPEYQQARRWLRDHAHGLSED